MRTYIIKRLLIMIPTFFGISLIVFLVLNLAPGHPGGTKQSTDMYQAVGSEQSAESQRIFREQFNLDKPILFNTLYALERDSVLDKLEAIASRGDDRASDAEKIAAHRTLQDYGQYSVPHLIQIAKDLRDATSEEKRAVRDFAIHFVRVNARRRLIDPYAKSHPPEIKKKNQAIDAENAQIRRMKYSIEAPEEEKQEVIGQWLAWWDEHKERYEYTTSEKVYMTFFETRFATYWYNLLQLDFGVSLVTKEPVMETLMGKLKYSISLSISSILIAYLISIPIGIYSAVDKDSLVDRSMTVVLFMLYALPSFFVGTLLLFYFSYGSDYESLRIFPIGGWQSRNHMELTTLEQFKDILWHCVLPVACMTYASFAALSRYMRTGLLDVIRADYVRTARAKGLPEWKVIMKHAVRNGLMPILTLLAGLLPAILGGSVIIEVIFAIPGMGLWMIESIFQRDYNVIMAIQLLSTLLILFGILLTDLSYALVDPRISYE